MLSLVFITLAALSSVGLLVGTGNVALAAVPIVGASVAYAIWRLPIRHSVFAFMCAVIAADVMPRSPTSALEIWRSPVEPLRLLFLDNLNKLTGVAALRVSGTELLLVALLLLAAVRTVSGDTTDQRGRVPGIAPISASLALAFAAVVLLEGWGMARGGDFRQSLWQFRQLLFFPIIAALVAYSVRSLQDLFTAAKLLTAVAFAKILIGLYYYVIVVSSGAGKPATVTSHADTMLFVAVIAMWTGWAAFRPSLGRLIVSGSIVAWMLLGIVINNRRTAYVSLAAALMVLVPLLPRRTRHALTRLGLVLLPFVLAYLLAGRYTSSGIFAPAASVMSVLEQKDASSATRDIENYNLTLTLKQHLLAGSGWGHPYAEVSVAYDVSTFFEQYRFVAHNSVLWLLSVGGILGFTMLWLNLGLGIYFARRSHFLARTPAERMVAYTAIVFIVIYMLQAWADMGTQSWTGVLLVALALTGAGKLATLTGAWPAHLRLVGRARRAAGVRATQVRATMAGPARPDAPRPR
jgi:hypothetical protein